jgi:hypothetical protein
MAAGDSVRLILDKTLHPTLPDYINGVVQQPVTSISLIDQDTQQTVPGTQYIVEYDTDDLNGIIPALQACDVSDLECVTCCDVLGDRIDDLPATTAGDGILITGGADAADPYVISKDYDHSVTRLDVPDTFVPGTPLPPADLSGVAAEDDKDGDVVYATYDNDFVVAWFYASGALTNGQVIEWPASSVTSSAEVGFTRYTFTDKTGATTSWDIYPNQLSVVTTNTDVNGIVTVTHDDGTGNTVSWFSAPGDKLILTDGVITGDTLAVTVDTGAGHVQKFLHISDSSDAIPGEVVGSLQAFATADQVVSNVEEAIDFDTTGPIDGCLSRSGSVFTTTKAVRLRVSARLQVDQLDVANVLTVWTKVNGVIVPNSAMNAFTGVLNSNTPETYDIILDLAASDTVEFFAITSTVAGVNFDFTAAAGAVPAIPAASVSLEAVSV